MLLCFGGVSLVMFMLSAQRQIIARLKVNGMNDITSYAKCFFSIYFVRGVYCVIFLFVSLPSICYKFCCTAIRFHVFDDRDKSPYILHCSFFYIYNKLHLFYQCCVVLFMEFVILYAYAGVISI